jgi:hypothetical protein
MHTNTGGKVTVYSESSPRPPWAESKSCQRLEWALGLLQHPDAEVASLAASLVNLIQLSARESSSIAQGSYYQGIAEHESALRARLYQAAPGLGD